MEIVALITGIVKAIPILDKWVEQFMVYYFNKSIDKMKLDNFKAIKKAINEKDQRDLEKNIGNPLPGNPSGDAGSEIVDDLPGVNKP